MNPMLVAILLAAAPEALADGDAPSLSPLPEVPVDSDVASCTETFPRSMGTGPTSRDPITLQQLCRDVGGPANRCDIDRVISAQAALCIAKSHGVTSPIGTELLPAGPTQDSPGGLMYDIGPAYPKGDVMLIDATTGGLVRSFWFVGRPCRTERGVRRSTVRRRRW